MRHILVLAASLAIGAAAMLGLAVSPAAEALPSPIVKPQDSCMCGGEIYFTLRSRSFNGSETTCVYNVLSNGQQLPWALYRTWSGNVACGPNG